MTAAAASLHRSTQDAPQLISRAPDQGKNQAAGTVGFTFTQSNIPSQGIACFTRWLRLHDIRVSHALVVTGEKECLEAHMDGGVKRTKLDTSFNDAHGLDAQPRHPNQGVLVHRDATIDPRELLEDDPIFEPWHQSERGA